MMTSLMTYGVNLASIPILTLMNEDTDDDYIMADEGKVWSVAYEEIDLPTILTPSWDFASFDHCVALSVK